SLMSLYWKDICSVPQAVLHAFTDSVCVCVCVLEYHRTLRQDLQREQGVCVCVCVCVCGVFVSVCFAACSEEFSISNQPETTNLNVSTTLSISLERRPLWVYNCYFLE